MPKPKQPYSTELLRQTRRDIGTQIHTARLQHKMPLEKLARLTGIPVWKLDFYELGKGEITIEDLLKVGCVFGG